MKNRVFLGGTWNKTTWRDDLIKLLDKPEVDFFNPVVEDWTPECQEIEKTEKEVHCNVHLYVLTSAMTGVFSVAEVVDSANTYGKITILHVMPKGFTEGQIRSLKATAELVTKAGGIAYFSDDIEKTAIILNELTCDID